MKAVVFNDYCCVGNCALKVNLSVLMQNGVEVIGIPTKIFSSHMAYRDYISFETPNLSEIENLVRKNVEEIDLIYIGYLDSKNQFEIINKYIDNVNAKIVLDPILGDNGKKYSGSSDEQILFYREILKKSDCITPNLTEAILLTDFKKSFFEISRNDVEIIAEKLFKMGVKEVVIKGFIENRKLNTLYFNGRSIWYDVECVDVKICGTGDAFSSLISFEILRKNSLEYSIDKIQKKLLESIKLQHLHNGLNEISTENLKLN